MTLVIPTVPGLSMMPLFARSGSYGAKLQLHQLAQQVGKKLYAGYKDKGNANDQSELWHHVSRVDNLVLRRFIGKDTPEELSAKRAVAILHDFPELKEEDGKKRARTQAQWMSVLHAEGFPQEIIDDIDATALHENEAYLNLYVRCGMRPRACAVKLHGDLMDHAMRTDVIEKPSQKFTDKINYLYEMGRFYLMACEADVSVRGKSVAEYIMKEPRVPRNLKNADVLARYSPPGTIIPAPVYGVHAAFENSF